MISIQINSSCVSFTSCERTLVLPSGHMTRRFTTNHRCVATTLPNTKTNKKHFLLTFAMWGVWDSPTVKRKCFTLFLYAVKLSQYDGGSQWLMGQNDPKITQGFVFIHVYMITLLWCVCFDWLTLDALWPYIDPEVDQDQRKNPEMKKLKLLK